MGWMYMALVGPPTCTSSVLKCRLRLSRRVVSSDMLPRDSMVALSLSTRPARPVAW
ncbi:hypothetical protein D3C84_1053560 [compost metagenome]